MKTEVQLQGQVIGSLYVLATVIMAMLGVQNYRYGVYPLVYTASLLSLVFLGISIYARFAYKVTSLERANLAALSFAIALLLWESQDHALNLMYWLIPLGLFAYIALPLKQARILNVIALTLFTITLYQQSTLLNVSLFITCYVLMIAFAGTFAALHQKRSRTLVELAIHEPITSAYNIRHLEDTLNKEICRSGRTEKPLSLVALEVDYFDQVEEMHGLAAQQELLQQLSETLNGMIRAGDSQYFDAKQRFYLLLPCTPEEGVLVISERIRRAIEESTWPTIDSITASLGCTTYLASHGESTVQHMLNNAHQGLADSHRNGHNKVSLHNSAPS